MKKHSPFLFFFSEATDAELERRHMIFKLILVLICGTAVGIAVVFWFIQNSADLQKLLGLRGRYVELVNMVKE